MNLLKFKNRFKPTLLGTDNVSEVNGYLYALQDLLQYLQEKTEFNPAKRYIDSVDLLNAITETNAALAEVHKRNEADLKEAFKELDGTSTIPASEGVGVINLKKD